MVDGEVLVIVEIADIHDAEGLKSYQAAARTQIGPWGGAVIGRGGETLDGVPAFGTLLVQRWPSRARFLEWQESPEYRALVPDRRRSANLRIGIVPLL